MLPSGCTLRARRCAPVHVAALHSYPNDLKLLNDAREKTERIIDDPHAVMPGKVSKPRTYRKKARRDFLTIALNLDVLLRFLGALIQEWSAWQALMTAKCRAYFCCRPSLTWIYAPAMKLQAA